MKCISFLVFAGLAAGNALAVDWMVRKGNVENCYVVPADADASQYPKILAKVKTRREACLKAKELKTEDASESAKCPEYSVQAVSLCKTEQKIDLKKK